MGRTGSGKTALLKKLEEEHGNTIRLSPFDLSLEYISNSTVLKFFSEAGVNLDLFYKLLWRHVFTVELIKKIHRITDYNSEYSLFSIQRAGWSRSKKKQYDYLLEHGGEFWKETSERVKDATRKTETGLTAAVKSVLVQGLELSAIAKFSDEKKYEICQLGQEVVNKVKIRDLNEMFELLSEELESRPHENYFVVVDELDENWADDTLKYKLINALIETVRDFTRLTRVKIVLCLRTDLIERVLRQIKGPGYQEEKVKSLFLYLRWTREELIKLLDKRIHRLVRDSFTNAVITHEHVLPNMGRSESGIEYMLDRTQLRPRDIITFFNYCIQEAVDRPSITKQMLVAAEAKYSEDRKTSLVQEWRSDYPELLEFLTIFKKRPDQFRLLTITNEEVQDFVLRYTAMVQRPEGPLSEAAFRYFNGVIKEDEFRAHLASVMYSVGFLGMKTESYKPLQWADPESRSIPASEIRQDFLCTVHKMYWLTLGISPRRGD